MKKFLTILLVVLMSFSMIACSSDDADDDTTGGDETEETFSVAVLLPYIGDQSYFDTLNNGIEEANSTYDNVTVRLIEVGNTTEQSVWEAAFDEVCEDGEYDLVVSGNSSYEAYLWDACEKYPDQMFMNFDYDSAPEDGIPSNCYIVGYALDDLGYVVGALSALLTETGTVGVVVGMDNLNMNQFIGGYCQVLTDMGVQYIIYYPNSFTDTALGYEGTTSMIEKGADVIWQVAGGLGNGVINACADNDDVWCIGVDQDQYVQFAESNPDWAATVITSALKNTDVALLSAIEDLVNGELEAKMGTEEILGIAENGVGIAENDYYLENVSEEIREQLAEILQQVTDGEVEVVDTREMTDYETEWPVVRDGNRID